MQQLFGQQWLLSGVNWAPEGGGQVKLTLLIHPSAVAWWTLSELREEAGRLAHALEVIRSAP